MQAFPPGVIGRFALRRPVVFEVPSSPLPYWVLDFRRRAVYRLSSAAARHREHRAPSNEAVLADAIAKRLVHVVHGSMRIARPPPPGGRGRRPHVLGPARAVGARVRPARRIAAAPARRGDVAAPVRVVRVGRLAPRQPEASLFERLASRFTTTTERAGVS